MKKMMAVLFVATLAFAAGADQLDHWVYDSTAKTISSVDPAKRPLLLLEPYGLQIILR